MALSLVSTWHGHHMYESTVPVCMYSKLLHTEVRGEVQQLFFHVLHTQVPLQSCSGEKLRYCIYKYIYLLALLLWVLSRVDLSLSTIRIPSVKAL
jgi:hypothetical protein